MAFRQRSISDSQERLQERVNALNNVEPDFDLGNGIDKATLESFVDTIQSKREEYNSTLSNADTLRAELDNLERQADDVSERLLASVLATYGRDSIQYQEMGGVRKSKIQYTGSRPETYSGNGTEQGSGTGST